MGAEDFEAPRSDITRNLKTGKSVSLKKLMSFKMFSNILVSSEPRKGSRSRTVLPSPKPGPVERKKMTIEGIQCLLSFPYQIFDPPLGHEISLHRTFRAENEVLPDSITFIFFRRFGC